MSGTCACLGLPCFTTFCLDFLEQPSRLVTAWRALHWSSCLLASNKIEYSYLNWNLMVQNPRLLTLDFDERLERRKMSLLLCTWR